MKQHDVSHEIFEMVDSLLEQVVPAYQHRLNVYNFGMQYQWLDSTISDSMQISMKDRAIYYFDLEEVMNKALEEGLITDNDLEDFLLQYRLKVKLD